MELRRCQRKFNLPSFLIARWHPRNKHTIVMRDFVVDDKNVWTPTDRMPDFKVLRKEFELLILQQEILSREERALAIDHIFRSRGYEWVLLAAPNPTQPCLVVSGTWSLAPIFLSRTHKEVVIWDIDPRRVEIMETFFAKVTANIRVLRFSYENLTQLLDDCAEPFACITLEDSFGYLSVRPRQLRRRFFEQIGRVLASEGHFCVVAQNRFSFSRLRRTVKGRLNRVHLLPRFLWKRHERAIIDQDSFPPPSLDSVRRTLRQSSLPVQRTYYLYPEYRRPRELVGWDGALPRHIGSRKLAHVLDSLHLMERLHDAFVMFAGARAPDSIVDMIIKCLECKLDAKCAWNIIECSILPKRIAMFMVKTGLSQDIVLRIPLSGLADSLLQHAWQTVEALRDQVHCLRSLVPEPIAQGEVYGLPYYAEAKCVGVTARQFLGKKPVSPKMLEQLSDLLLQFNRATMDGALVDECFLMESVETRFREISLRVPALSDKLRETFFRVADEFRAVSVPQVWVHGDFTAKNVLCEPNSGAPVAIIDWDGSRRCGLPLNDLLHFTLSTHRYRERLSIGDVTVRALKGTIFTAGEQRLIERYQQSLDIERNLVKPLLVIDWANCVAGRLQEFDQNPTNAWLHSNLFEPIEEILCLLRPTSIPNTHVSSKH